MTAGELSETEKNAGGALLGAMRARGLRGFGGGKLDNTIYANVVHEASGDCWEKMAKI